MHNIYKKKGFGNTVNSFKFVDTNFHGLRDHFRTIQVKLGLIYISPVVSKNIFESIFVKNKSLIFIFCKNLQNYKCLEYLKYINQLITTKLYFNFSTI